MKKCLLTLGLALSFFGLVGCDPDEMTVTVTTSSIEKAVAGNVATAKVKLTFDSVGSDEDGEVAKVMKIAQGYLGESGKISKVKGEMGEKLVATMKAAVVASGKESLAADSLVWVIVQKGEVLAVVPNPNKMAQLNKEIAAVNSMYDISLCAKKTSIQIVGTSDASFVFSGIAVKVDGVPELECRRTVGEGDSVSFDFVGGSDGPYTGTLCPQLRINPKTAEISPYRARPVPKPQVEF